MNGNNFVPPTDADVVEKGFVPPSDAVEKKNLVSNVSSQPVQQPTTPSSASGIEYNFSGADLGANQVIGGVEHPATIKSIEQITTEKAVTSSKKATKSLNAYNAAKADVDSYESFDKIQNSYPQLFAGGVTNLQGLGMYDDQSQKYVPNDAFYTDENGVVKSKYTKQQLNSFDKEYRDILRKPTLDLPTDANERLNAINQQKVKQNEAAAAYNADYQELTEQVNALKAIKQERMTEYGIGDAFMDGMAQTGTAIRLALKASSGNDEEMQDELERMYVNQLSQPDKNIPFFNPLNPVSGLNPIAYPAAEVLGGQAAPLAAIISTSLATGGIGGAATAVSTYGTMGYGSNLAQGYIQARAQGKLPEESLVIGKDYAKFGAATGAIEGGLGFINPFMKAGGLVNKTLMQGVKTALIDGGIDGTVAMGMQLANNKYGQSLGLEVDNLDGVLEQGVGEVGFSLAMNALFSGAARLKPEVHKMLVNGLAQSDVPSIQTVVNQAIQDGVLDAAKGQTVLGEIMDAKRGYEKMPADLDEDTKNEILPDMQRKAALEKQLADKDDAFKPAVEAEIETLNRNIQEKIGAPLTIKEQKAYEKLKDKKADPEMKLTPSEKADLNHYGKREKAAEKRIEKELKEAEQPKTYTAGDVVELEPTVTQQSTANETDTQAGAGTDVVTEGGTIEQQPERMDAATPDVEQGTADNTEVEAVAKMGTGEAVSVDAASIFEEHSNKRGNFAKDKVLEKMGGLKDKAIAITDNFDSMIADLQARADKGEVAFRIDC